MDHPTILKKSFSYYVPITVRSTLLGALSIYFIAWPVRLNSDIIAAGFAACTLAIIALFVSLALLSRRRLAKSLSISLSLETNSRDSESQSVWIAGQAIPILAKVSGIQISPFYELRIRYIFEQRGIVSLTHSLDSASPYERFLTDSINFPHRGNWLLKGIALNLVDRLGLTNTALPSLLLNQIIRVEPKPFHCPRWPVLASTIRVDDQVNHPVERKGDLYDLKQYHPSDGARKIVWKLFAKSGQLFSRYPEPAFSPEGKVALLCLAKRYDDKLCAETISYLQELENLDIEIIFASLSPKARVAINSAQALEYLIEDVWESEAVLSQDAVKSLMKLIDAAQGQNSERSVQTVVMAISEDSLNNSEYMKLVKDCQMALHQAGIRPTIFISSGNSNTYAQEPWHSNKTLHRIKNLLVENTLNQRNSQMPSEAKDFIASINSTQSDLAWS